MKFFISLVTLLIFFGLSAIAQKKKNPAIEKEPQIPENVTTIFKNQFAVAENGQWKKTFQGHYIASFINSSKHLQSVEYDDQGKVVKSKISYPADSLPDQVNHALAIQYSQLKVSECMRMEIPGIKPYDKIRGAVNENEQKEILISEEGTVSE